MATMPMDISLDGAQPTEDSDRGESVIVQGPDGPSFPLTRGMEVCGADGVVVGHLKAVRDIDLLVDRPLKRDVYAPFDAVQAVLEGRLVLAVRSDEIDAMGWPKPPVLPFHDA